MKNDWFWPEKIGLKTTSGDILGMYDLDFSCSSIFYQLWTHIGRFKAKKMKLNFHLISAPFSPPGRLPNATTTPWKWFLRVPWWNTFQWDPREPPKPFLEKKYFRPEIPNPLSQPSVHWLLGTTTSNLLTYMRVISFRQKTLPSRDGYVDHCYVGIS